MTLAFVTDVVTVGIKDATMAGVTVDTRLGTSAGLGVFEPGVSAVGEVLGLLHTSANSQLAGTVLRVVGNWAFSVVLMAGFGGDGCASKSGAGDWFGATGEAGEVGHSAGGAHVASGTVAFVGEFFEHRGRVVVGLAVGHTDTSNLVAGGAGSVDVSVGKDGTFVVDSMVVVVFSDISEFNGGSENANSEASNGSAVVTATHVANPFGLAVGASFTEDGGSVAVGNNASVGTAAGNTTADGDVVEWASGGGLTGADVLFLHDDGFEVVEFADA